MSSKPASPRTATKSARPAGGGKRVGVTPTTGDKTATKKTAAKKPPSVLAPASDPAAPVGPVRPPPIFVHSSFRTSSTWLWTRFRAARNTVAYCEIFHEVLGELKVEQIPSISPNSWLSHHPQSSPYFIEFFDLLEPRGGARHFSPAFAFETFIPREGPRGDLSQAELDYVATLIANPADPAKVAVLTDNRTLGRCVGLKRSLGGLHILSYRNLLHQWNSYSNQQREHNRYFLDTIKHTVEYAEHTVFFRRMKDFLNLRPEIVSGDWLDYCDYDDIFVAFAGLHLYFYMAMYDAIDVLIDVNRLTEDRAYAGQIEATIAERGGVQIDLSSARASIEAPLRPISDPVGVRYKIETFFQHAVQEVKPSPAGEAFARRLVDEMWAEHGRFTFYTRSLFASPQVDPPAIEAASAAVLEAEAALAAKSAETDAALAQMQDLKRELDSVRGIAQQMMSEADQRRQATIAVQRRELDLLRSETARDKAQNSELAARVSALDVELRHEATFNAKLVASVDALRRAFEVVEREVGLRDGSLDHEAVQRLDNAANDADAQVQVMIAAIDDLGRVLGQDREKIAELEARKGRDGARIVQLLARRRTLLDQRDAVLDLIQATRTRYQVAAGLGNHPTD